MNDKTIAGHHKFIRETFDEAAFFAAIQGCMAYRKVTAKQLSEAVGVSETTLSRMWAGTRTCDAASLAALSAWAGINPANYCDFKPKPMENGAERIRSFSQLYERHAGGINIEHQKLRDEAIAACHFEHDEFLVWKEDPSDKHSAWYVVLPTSKTVGSGDLLSFNAHFDDAVDEARARFVAVACTRALRGLLNPHDDQSKQWQAGFSAGVDSIATQPPQDERSPKCHRHGVYMCVSCMRSRSSAEPAQPVALSTLTDMQLAAAAYDGYDEYWAEDSNGIQTEAWAASAKAVLALAASAPAQQAGLDVFLLELSRNALSDVKTAIAKMQELGDKEPIPEQWWAVISRALYIAATQSYAPPPQHVAAEVEKDTQRLDWLERQGYAYGFEDMHEGNRWLIEGPFRTLRDAIDSDMAGTGSDESKKVGSNV